jgi:hypothetical protein
MAALASNSHAPISDQFFSPLLSVEPHSHTLSRQQPLSLSLPLAFNFGFVAKSLSKSLVQDSASREKERERERVGEKRQNKVLRYGLLSFMLGCQCAIAIATQCHGK